ncbi:hypothetical protein ACFS7Z_13370 [Pontibacter toksunensis]|uniref:STAS/SEC14 domain-containing protein n=1 Tax=Pontibacter toksunensis TaxID=1332631 RepID=A0ABW6BU73_9BACT
MIIPDPVVKLDYDPARDVLFVAWPDFSEYTVSEAEYVLSVVIETVRTYDIKYLVTDTRNRMVQVPDSRYKAIILQFAKDLVGTRLQKLARVVTESTAREKPISEVRQETNLTIPMRNFGSVEEAMDWLTSS